MIRSAHNLGSCALRRGLRCLETSRDEYGSSGDRASRPCACAVDWNASGRSAGRFGVLPNFFRLAPETPEITANLWGFAKFAYLDNPLPSIFKERLFVYLSRFCDVRYCISRHVGFLTGLGRPAGDADAVPQTIDDVLRLLRNRLADGEELDALIAACARSDVPLPEALRAGSAIESAVISCASHVFLQTPRAAACRRGAAPGAG